MKIKNIFISLTKNLFASVPLSIFLMIVYALSIGWATFIEKDYGTLVAQDVIYHSWWFEGLNIWLMLNILGCMYLSAKHNFKVNILLFHLSLVIIILGAGITRHFGFEGRMVLESGQTSSFVLSSDKFLNVLVSNDIGETGGPQDILPLESFKQGYSISLSPYVRYSSFSLETKVYDKPLKIHSLEVVNYSLAGLYNDTMRNNRKIEDIDKNELDSKMKENHYVARFKVEYDGISKDMIVSNGGEIQSERFGNRYITLSWGPKNILLPFSLRLDRFEVQTYPGSRMESSFASYVEVLDSKKKNFEYKIYMNHVLDYRGYRFFQSEYMTKRDENGMPVRDENGMPIYTATILSVNNDPGKITTYIGYTLMILGAIWLVFDPSSRFRRLGEYVKAQKALGILLPFVVVCVANFTTPLEARHTELERSESEVSIESKITRHTELSRSESEVSKTKESQNTESTNLDSKTAQIIESTNDKKDASTFASQKSQHDAVTRHDLLSRSESEVSKIQNLDSIITLADNAKVDSIKIAESTSTQNKDASASLQHDEKTSPKNDTTDSIESKTESKNTESKDSTPQNLNNLIEYNKILESQNKELEPILSDMSKEAIQKRIDGLKKIPKDKLKNFASIQTQGMDGRIKLLDTLSDEIIRKITGKSSFQGINHNEFLLALMVMPQDMVKVQFIKIKNPEIKKLLGVTNSNYVSFEDLFYADKLEDVYRYAITQDTAFLEAFQNAYKLYHFSNIALKKSDADRSEFDKEILKIDEKMDILLPFSIWNYLKIFPEKGDTNWKVLGNVMNLQHPFTMYFYHAFSTEIKMGIVFGKWDGLDNSLKFLHNYQAQSGGELLLDSAHVKSELFLNHANIFPISQYFYLFFGILLFFISLIAIISDKKIPNWLGRGIYYILLLVFLAHTLGLILRWYIGGHAPWSNAYESMLYIAWASALSGIIILRKSYFALCGASFLAGMALLVAHWGFMDPYIGNLQPVLQSYWLNIHVAVIVASYGFLGLSLMLGIINLILFIFRSEKRVQVDKSILSLTAINEMSMTIGILMLIIGTFLGGVWANESWGRYWSWDSKETWSLVSVGVYAVVLHVRLLKPMYLPYIYNALSVVAFYSILMTYFGVNYYLATGMHSYGRGDSDVVNYRLYIALALTAILIALSFFKRNLIPPKPLT